MGDSLRVPPTRRVRFFLLFFSVFCLLLAGDRPRAPININELSPRTCLTLITRDRLLLASPPPSAHPPPPFPLRTSEEIKVPLITRSRAVSLWRFHSNPDDLEEDTERGLSHRA